MLGDVAFTLQSRRWHLAPTAEGLGCQVVNAQCLHPTSLSPLEGAYFEHPLRGCLPELCLHFDGAAITETSPEVRRLMPTKR
jgi:hypothetical protein